MKTVLLVDDSECFRLLLASGLRAAGLDVVEAPDGEAAVLICRRLKEPPDLLLTDIHMPGMDGFELGRRLLAAYPGLTAWYMSADARLIPADLSRTGSILMQKPFFARDLLRRLHDLPQDGAVLA